MIIQTTTTTTTETDSHSGDETYTRTGARITRVADRRERIYGPRRAVRFMRAAGFQQP